MVAAYELCTVYMLAMPTDDLSSHLNASLYYLRDVTPQHYITPHNTISRVGSGWINLKNPTWHVSGSGWVLDFLTHPWVTHGSGGSWVAGGFSEL